METTSKQELKSFVSRIESRENDKAELAEDIRSIYAEAKGSGYDVKALRAVIRMRKQDKAERLAHEEMVDTYMIALGMLSDTPLGRSAVERATSRPKSEQVDLEEAISEKDEDLVTVSEEGRTYKVPGSKLGATIKAVVEKKLARHSAS